MRLVSIVRDSSVGSEDAADDRRYRGFVESVDRISQRLACAALVEYGLGFERFEQAPV